MASLAPSHVLAATATAAAGLFGLNSYFGLSRDLSAAQNQRKYQEYMGKHIARLGPQSTTLYRMLELAEPTADALYFEGRSWTWGALKREVDTIALGLRTLGVKDGDNVTVFMSNSPEMVVIVYALTKLGAVPALTNSHLRDDTLLHCVRVGAGRFIVSTPDIAIHAAHAAQSVQGDVVRVTSLNLGSFHRGSSIPGVEDFPFPDPTLKDDIIPPPRTLSDCGAFIFTSGTTGKPKACSIKNMLIAVVSCPTPADCPREFLQSKYFPLRIFSCMPLFHGTTFFTGLCYAAGTSQCFVVSRKFSARNFWREVHDSRATRILYVGELCRFLLATPPGPYDNKHQVTVAGGNGLQKDVWMAFQQKFNINEIREFYRSTEGLVKYDNIHFKRQGSTGAGRVGFRGTLARRREKEQHIVKFDYDTEQPVRDPETGFCIVAERGEAGEAIALINDMSTYTDYHNNAEATEKKFLRDAFSKGDVWQRSGDLLVVENNGWVRFVDRIGDTFRWKGENVSAGEIRGYIAELDEVEDAIVVGKQLKGYDGQAGVAAISLSSVPSLGGDEDVREEDFMASLHGRLKSKGVPNYALPRLVVLIRGGMEVGDTFKHAKQVVKAVAWGDVEAGRSQWWLDLSGKSKKGGPGYVRLDGGGWKEIVEGRAKL